MIVLTIPVSFFRYVFEHIRKQKHEMRRWANSSIPIIVVFLLIITVVHRHRDQSHRVSHLAHVVAQSLNKLGLVEIAGGQKMGQRRL